MKSRLFFSNVQYSAWTQGVMNKGESVFFTLLSALLLIYYCHLMQNGLTKNCTKLTSGRLLGDWFSGRRCTGVTWCFSTSSIINSCKSNHTMMGRSSGEHVLSWWRLHQMTEMTLIDYKPMTSPKSSGNTAMEIRKMSLCRLFLRFILDTRLISFCSGPSCAFTANIIHILLCNMFVWYNSSLCSC